MQATRCIYHRGEHVHEAGDRDDLRMVGQISCKQFSRETVGSFLNLVVAEVDLDADLLQCCGDIKRTERRLPPPVLPKRSAAERYRLDHILSLLPRLCPGDVNLTGTTN